MQAIQTDDDRVAGSTVRDGDFTSFCEREFPVIVGALTLWCGDRSVAEEVTAEAFARAYREWRRLRGLDAPGAWVRRVAMNLATSTFRRRWAERRARRRLHADVQVEHLDPDGAAVISVRAALLRLSEEHRTVLVLRHYLDLPVAEVAQVMGRTPSAVTSLTSRATAAFVNELGDSRPDDRTFPAQEAGHDR